MSASSKRQNPSQHFNFYGPENFYVGKKSNEGWYRRGMHDLPRKHILNGLKPDIIQIIERPVPHETDVEISEVEYVTSYNWINTDDPTILVPGSPRMWRADLSMPMRVPRDSGTTFVDSNGHRFPSYPLLPIFVAADIMEREGHSKVHWGSFDVVTDRNSLRKLLSFAEDASPKDFRIDLQLAGPWTMLLGRWEERTVESSEMTGYGDSFERMATTPAPGCEQATLAGHHRVASYNFAELKMVVRYEVDACFPPPDEPDSSTSAEDTSAEDTLTSKASASAEDALTDALSALSFSEPTPEPTQQKPYGINIIRAGTVAPQSSLVKVKTRSLRNYALFKWAQAYPQLLLGQTKTVMIGVHSAGVFSETHTVELDSPKLEEVARSVQPGLRKLRRLLGELQDRVMERGKEARLSLVCRDGVLQLMERSSGRPLLPQEILERFEE